MFVSLVTQLKILISLLSLSFWLNRQFGRLVFLQPSGDDQSGNGDRSEHRSGNTDGKCDRKASDRAAAEIEQNKCGDQSRQVGVDTGCPSFGKTGFGSVTGRTSVLTSSRILSKISTLASTAIPIVRMIPAMPGKVGWRR